MKSLGFQPYGQHQPDLPDLGNQGSKVANMIPRAVGYAPLPTLQNLTTTPMDERCRGAFGVRNDLTSTPFTYGGDAAKLYRVVDAAWVDATGPSGPYITDRKWDFEQWENEVIATNGVDLPQRIITGGAAFEDLITNPTDPDQVPRGRLMTVLRNFLVFADVTTDSVRHGDQVRWSGFNDHRDFVRSGVTLSGLQDLRGNGGDILGLTGGTVGVVIQERSLWYMTFVGYPIIFRFDNIEDSVGTLMSGSVIRFGDRVYFLAADGFRVLKVGEGASTQIGEERVDNAVLSDLDQGNLDKASVAVWSEQSCIVWSYPGSGNIGGVSNRVAIYNYAIDRWAEGERSVDTLLRVAQPATSLEALGVIYGALENIPGSLDDPRWAGGALRMGAVGTDHNAAAFTGPASSSSIETGEQDMAGRGAVTYLRPGVDGASGIRMRVGARDRQGNATAFGPAIPVNAVGVCPVRIGGRYLRTKTEIEGDFTAAVGYEPYGGRLDGR